MFGKNVVKTQSIYLLYKNGWRKTSVKTLFSELAIYYDPTFTSKRLCVFGSLLDLLKNHVRYNFRICFRHLVYRLVHWGYLVHFWISCCGYKRLGTSTWRHTCTLSPLVIASNLVWAIQGHRCAIGRVALVFNTLKVNSALRGRCQAIDLIFYGTTFFQRRKLQGHFMVIWSFKIQG